LYAGTLCLKKYRGFESSAPHQIKKLGSYVWLFLFLMAYFRHVVSVLSVYLE